MHIPKNPLSGFLPESTGDVYISYVWLVAIAGLSLVLYQIVTRSEDILSLVIGVRNSTIFRIGIRNESNRILG